MVRNSGIGRLKHLEMFYRKEMKRRILLAALIMSTVTGFGQVTQNVVIEHFTNTRCSICASRNPGLYNNLKNAPEVLHLAIHPSSPYSTCKLNQHNVKENDDRTKYYGLYGSTPKVAVQGEAKSAGVDFTSKDLYASYQGKTTPVQVELQTTKKGGDSLVVRVVVRSAATHALSGMRLYAVAAEDTVFYKSPNGEDEHYDVFRKVLIDEDITLPKTAGDSVVFIASAKNHPDWDASRMYVMAFVQHNSSKKVEQVESTKGDADTGGGTVGIDAFKKSLASEVFPNPVTDQVTVAVKTNEQVKIQLFDCTGKMRLETSFEKETSLNIQELETGVYILRIHTPKGLESHRLVKL